MSGNFEQNYHRPLFENMPSLSDQAAWDLLEMMHGLINAYEEHFAEPLRRLRNQRYRELHELSHEERQMKLLIEATGQDPF